MNPSIIPETTSSGSKVSFTCSFGIGITSLFLLHFLNHSQIFHDILTLCILRLKLKKTRSKFHCTVSLYIILLPLSCALYLTFPSFIQGGGGQPVPETCSVHSDSLRRFPHSFVVSVGALTGFLTAIRSRPHPSSASCPPPCPPGRRPPLLAVPRSWPGRSHPASSSPESRRSRPTSLLRHASAACVPRPPRSPSG